MKIINNTDLNNLIVYAKKNLGIYKLVYYKYKNIYWTSIVLTISSIILLVIYVLLSIFKMNIIICNICVFLDFIISILSLVLLYQVHEKTKNNHLKIQNHRIKLLKVYYKSKNYKVNDIITINKQLRKRIVKIEKQKITILVILSILIMPVWEIFVHNYISNFSIYQIVKFILFTFLFSFVVITFISLFKRGLYLYEENIYIKNNINLIENIIYLNTYIIKEKKE